MLSSDVWKNASVAERELWRYVMTIFTPTATVPLYFQGNIVGSEFITYSANKIYIALNFMVGYQGAASPNVFWLALYNQLNVSNENFSNECRYYDNGAAAVRCYGNPIFWNNVFFSRIEVQSYNCMQFNGYKLTN